MKSNHSIQQFVPNKKLILHFDVDDVLRIKHHNKDLFVNILFYKGLLTMLQMGMGKIRKNQQGRSY
jgi:hypothetical protein